ncbi:hypothetical protein CEXT_607231 [Caerostris extrusa]|uniref:Secreted protein n=1 Tax=Caerostris extrusa TaxID=172846 RepID=A0AAV4VH81_CAEEX|nr:hypothetical protein CEXT_607231 [Caerostris extrusa]
MSARKAAFGVLTFPISVLQCFQWLQPEVTGNGSHITFIKRRAKHVSRQSRATKRENLELPIECGYHDYQRRT